MGLHHALRAASRAGGVDQLRNIVRRDRDRGVVRRTGVRVRIEIKDLELGLPAAEIRTTSIGYDRRYLCMRREFVEARDRVVRVEHHDGSASLEAGKHGS